MRAWRLIVIGLAVLAFAALVFPLVLSQNRLRATHSELVKARKAITELESALSGSRTELDIGNKARSESEADLKLANSQKQEFKKKFEDAQTELNEAKSQIARLMPQFEEANRVLEQAKAGADESAKRISDLEGKIQLDASQIQKLTAGKDTLQSQLDAVNSLSAPPSQ